MLAACALTSAQQTTLVVPPAYSSSEAPTLRWAAGTETALRQQWLVDAASLSPLIGRALDSIELRRDSSIADALYGCSIDVELRVSTSPLSSLLDASPTFGNQIGPDETLVLSGPVVVPASGAAPAGPSWSATETIRFDFQGVFVYRGGHLCIDLIARPVAPNRTFWPVDSCTEPAPGSVSYVGRSCHDPAVVAPLDGGRTHRVAEDDLIVGTTVTSFAFATPGAVAFLLFGLEPLTTPIPLDAAGAPGCTLDTLPFANLPGRAVSAPPVPALTRTGGIVTEEFTLPGSRSLVGSRFVLQWAELGGTGLRTTNAAVCDVAPAMPSLGVVLVEARVQGSVVPSQGRVERHAVPVLRISGS